MTSWATIPLNVRVIRRQVRAIFRYRRNPSNFRHYLRTAKTQIAVLTLHSHLKLSALNEAKDRRNR